MCGQCECQTYALCVCVCVGSCVESDSLRGLPGNSRGCASPKARGSALGFLLSLKNIITRAKQLVFYFALSFFPFSHTHINIIHTMISLDSICDFLELPTLRYHWQEILLSTLLCSIIFELSRCLSPLLFPKTFQYFKGVSSLFQQNQNPASCLIYNLTHTPINRYSTHPQTGISTWSHFAIQL